MKSSYYRFLNHFQGSYTGKILDEAFDLLGNLWLYLFIGITITTLIKIYLSKDKLAAFLTNKSSMSIPMASLIGVVSPLGSYIVIPLSAALYATGVPLPVLMALLVSSPLIDPNLFLLTQGAMGFEMALARVLAALALGILAGYLTQWMMNLRLLKLSLPNTSEMVTFAPGEKSETPGFKKFTREFYRMTLYIGKFFLLAIMLAAVIKIITPPNLMMRLFKGNTFLSILFTTSAGIPFYVCGGAAIPVVSELASLGLSKGAALAFFISGPVTKISNLILMSALFKRTIFLLYLGIGILGAILAGLVFDLL